MATIREHFQRRQRAITAIVVAAGLFAAYVPNHYNPNAWFLRPGIVGLVVALVLTPLFIAYTTKTYRCPRCGTPYHKMADKQQSRFSMLHDRRLYWDRWEACPHCGLSFNDPWT